MSDFEFFASLIIIIPAFVIIIRSMNKLQPGVIMASRASAAYLITVIKEQGVANSQTELNMLRNLFSDVFIRNDYLLNNKARTTHKLLHFATEKRLTGGQQLVLMDMMIDTRTSRHHDEAVNKTRTIQDIVYFCKRYGVDRNTQHSNCVTALKQMVY